MSSKNEKKKNPTNFPKMQIRRVGDPSFSQPLYQKNYKYVILNMDIVTSVVCHSEKFNPQQDF